MTRVSLEVLRVGACRHLECMAARGGRWRLVDFPALCGLIRHPTRGWLLYDTGYADHFFTATAGWPERLYRTALPVELPTNEILGTQLAAWNLRLADIGTLIVSHYHGDHIAGLRDFPAARFIALQADSAPFMALRGKRWRATLGGHLPGLLPDDYASRLTFAETCPLRDLPGWLAPFTQGFDLLGDGSLLGVPLPGHSHGQLGLFMPDADGRPVFLIADACWSLPALREGRPPAFPAMLLSAERQRFHHTFNALAGLAAREPAIALLPSHCPAAWQEYQNER
ncbi:MAG: MBL fold metallo-hydrolase [Candidatus Dactylopiibacterium carminicum]|uniref:MBL fold metallo-hydrolase n=1 Tax=Candidatus Dactylopiibacterium carminicum TaxID=857335 RepID=A0A272EQY4_9RHOO|nr:MBL fold metallo-hydrolase [Candidatus Dactylopiibacterium carminicum]KAF7600723.1 MBL fold metallo-hydrolase [Candidatus Dactylopiibacterium carminicum]PAS92482.1 MAG: MBL fold metallo-hydrolase [Candidatus Dactylopiibacterium carminicum]PAT00729.1 MAG: MBL fold metallo-hydrolase [Candidatus Dactylopiibacterium carminicum]